MNGKNKNTTLISALVVGALIALIPIIWFVTFKISASFENEPEKQAVACDTQGGATHTANIENDTITPSHINAARCDKLVIVNLDDRARRMAFGTHEQHVAYNGTEEQVLEQWDELTITLSQPGEFLFHDHNHKEVKATFLVTNN